MPVMTWTSYGMSRPPRSSRRRGELLAKINFIQPNQAFPKGRMFYTFYCLCLSFIENTISHPSLWEGLGGLPYHPNAFAELSQRPLLLRSCSSTSRAKPLPPEAGETYVEMLFISRHASEGQHVHPATFIIS